MLPLLTHWTKPSYYSHPTVNFRSKKSEASKEESKNIEDLRCKIIDDSQEIKALFARLVLNIYRLLQEKQVPVKDINVGLTFLGGHEHDGISSADLPQSTDLAGLFKHLGAYSSWFNYFTIQFLAVTFGGEEGKALMDSYEEELRSKVLCRCAYQCPEFALTRELPKHYKELTVKTEDDYMLYTVQDLSLLRNTMARLTKLKPSMFILKSVEEGCVLLTWAVPISCSSIISQISEHTAELDKYKIISIKTENEGALIRKDCSHLASQPEPKSECTPVTTSQNNDHLDVLKRLSNNAVEYELLTVYSGIQPCRHYSVNQCK